MSRRVKTICTVLFILLSGMYARAWYESATWLELGDEQRSEGRAAEAISSLRRSVSWKAPLLRYSDDALRELLEISKDESAAPETRKRALEEAKRGLSASRSLLDGISGRRAQLDSLNAKLSTASSAPAPVIREVYPPRVNYKFQLLAQISFLGWTAMVLLVIWRGFDRSGSMSARPLLYALCGWAALFGIWLLALRMA